MPQIHAEYELITEQEYERKTRTWSYKFCWLPQKCMETNKLLWLTGAYRGYKTRRYDMDMVDSYKWMCREEFLILRLMDKV